MMKTVDVFFRRRRSERELLALHDRVENPRLPMPPNEDTQAWDDWMQLEELQSLLAGLVSRRLEGASPDGDGDKPSAGPVG